MRLGYRYLSLKGATWDEETNIFPELFSDAIARINPDLGADDITRLLTDVKLLLDNEDLGKAFYDRLTERSGISADRLRELRQQQLPCRHGTDLQERRR
jgi:type I restriction enzyme R subunit